MALVSITREAVANAMVGAEFSILRDEEVRALISAVVDRVVLAVNAGGYWSRLATGRGKVPSELVHATIVLCRHALIAKAPGNELNGVLEGGTRSTEYRSAEALLERVAAGELPLEDYTEDAEAGDLIEDEAEGIIWGSEPYDPFNYL